MKKAPLALSLLCLVLSIWAPRTQADEPVTPADVERYVNLSLEDLLNQSVTSVNKRTQPLSDVAAAVYVITAEDIRHSGATSLPEVLRLAPGVDVAHIGGDRWAVSIRSFTSYLANKLLVLVDGRSAFSPNFGGVIWNTLQIPLANIQRIEVIRGPAGSVWGLNAVNGVINIITKSAKTTQKTMLTAGDGDETGPFFTARHGGQFGKDTYYNFYVQGQHGDGDLTATGDDYHDGFRHLAAGFRADREQGADKRMMTGNIYHVRSDGMGIVPDPSAPLTGYSSQASFTDDFAGFDLQSNFTRRLSGDSDIQANVSWTHGNLDMVMIAHETQDILDAEFRHRLRLADRHDFTWGVGYRWFSDTISDGLETHIGQSSATLRVASLFAQDEVALGDDLHLTLGARLDQQKYTGTELQPSASLLWHVNPRHSLWTSLAEARRIPSRGERTADFGYGVIPPGTLPVPSPLNALPALTVLRGTSATDSERMDAFEIGYRGQETERLFLDATVYVHRYKDLVAATSLNPNALEIGNGYLILPAPFTNTGTLTVQGLEVSADWRPYDFWHLQASYAYMHTGEYRGADPSFSSFVPNQIVSLLSSWRLNQDTDLNLWLRHVGQRPNYPYPALDAYNSIDLRLAWRPRKGVELSLVGQNLTDAPRQEFTSLVPTFAPARIERGVYGKIRLDF